MPHENLHITLVFLGNVEEQIIPELAEAAAGLKIPGFQLQIDRCGWWKRAKVAWLAPGHTPEPLLELVKQLNHLSRIAGIPIEDRDYSPHLTIARKLACPVKTCEREPVHWDVKEFCLVESVTHEKGARYRVVRCWGLTEQV